MDVRRTHAADFYDGFGILSDEQAEWIREKREESREKRKRRMRRLAEGGMKGLDVTFLIDYLNGEPTVEMSDETNGGADELRVMPATAYADALVAATARELESPVVAAESDLTHEEPRTVVAVDEYRDGSRPQL